MNGFWICKDKSSKNFDSLYFGSNGTFYSAQYNSSNGAIKDYSHHVGRWTIETDSGHIMLHISYAGVEKQGHFVNYCNKIVFNIPFFFMGEEWHKMK